MDIWTAAVDVASNGLSGSRGRWVSLSTMPPIHIRVDGNMLALPLAPAIEQKRLLLTAQMISYLFMAASDSAVTLAQGLVPDVGPLMSRRSAPKQLHCLSPANAGRRPMKTLGRRAPCCYCGAAVSTRARSNASSDRVQFPERPK